MKIYWMWLIIGLVGLLAVVGGWFWYMMQQPLYRPGMVHAEKNLRAALIAPPQSADSTLWQMESDIALYHQAIGQGRNVVVIHGGPGTPYPEPWPALSPLTATYQFHFYDQRGAGRSTRPFDRFASGTFYQNMQQLEQTLGIGAQVADIERIRQILGEEQLILVGHSWGALLATLYAAEFPEHVERMILISPADMLLMPSPRPDLFATVRQRLPVELHAGYDDYLARYLDFANIFTRSEDELQAINGEFVRYYQAALDRQTDQPAVDLLAQQSDVQIGGWMVYAMYFSLGQRHDYRGALAAIDVPVLVLHGAADLQPLAVAQEYAEHLPQAQLVTVPGADHFMYNSAPKRFVEEVAEFLAPAAVD